MDKKNLRKLVISRRNLFSPQEIREKSAEIREKLFKEADFIKAKNIFSYINFGSEVRTKEIISKCIEMEKKVLVPCVQEDSNKIIACEFQGFEKLKKSSLGVLEPIEVKNFPLEKIDLALVPGVAFDNELNRLGFGKGFFDRFLSKLPVTIPSIALSFELQVLPSVPVTKRDIKVKKILTEKRVIKASGL